MFYSDKKEEKFLSRLLSTRPEKNDKEKLAYYESLLNILMDGYFVFDQATNEIIDYNERLIEMFDLPLNVDLHELRVIQFMMRYLDSSGINADLILDKIPENWEGECVFNTQHKKLFYGYISSNVFYKAETKCQVISIKDITANKMAEQEVVIYKNNVENAAKAKARFLSSMSHELRTPLNGIIGTSNLMLTEPQLSENIKQHIGVLKYSSEHMLGIINDILDFSKIDAGKLELKKHPINLKVSLEKNIRSFEAQYSNKNIPLIFDADLSSLDLYVLTDEIKLCQVINNLLSNALKFTNDGSVTFVANVKETSAEKIQIYFEVKDTGIGIPEDKQAEIFQGFSQAHADDQIRNYGGTGLGLTISEKLVEKFGGQLEVESEVGIGSRFFFTVSFEKDEHQFERIKKDILPDTTADTKGLRILVVEDNEVNANILISFLHKWEVNIKEAENGVHALELMKYHKFDLILMDLEMPEMDGYTAIKKIRETDKEIPVLAFTATLLENMETLIFENGFNDYVLKPYRPAELKKKILKYAPHRKVDYA